MADATTRAEALHHRAVFGVAGVVSDKNLEICPWLVHQRAQGVNQGFRPVDGGDDDGEQACHHNAPAFTRTFCWFEAERGTSGEKARSANMRLSR